MVTYPVPSVLPKSVPDLRVRRERSLTRRITSRGVGSLSASSERGDFGGVSREMEMFGWKISVACVSRTYQWRVRGDGDTELMQLPRRLL